MMNNVMNTLAVKQLLLAEGWVENRLIEWDSAGNISALGPIPAGYDGPEAGTVVAGMPNIHSHAFQRLSAGLTEYRYAEDDSFWSWRQLMYAFASKITPEQLEEIATHLYREMLWAGYTSVCEFNYLHNDEFGRPYMEPDSFFTALIRAAKRAGIGLTLLPVFYQRSGFGAETVNDGQRRFATTLDEYMQLWASLQARAQTEGIGLGVAPHSLRAVSESDLQQLIARVKAISPEAPVHIHISEQIREVEDCLEATGCRPFELLQRTCAVDQSWCLVHGTHFDKNELAAVAEIQAVVAICPTTEANLGDGIFDWLEFASHGGRWGIGSDSNTLIDSREELMLLEYSQRLLRRKRNIVCDSKQAHVGTHLYQEALKGGSQVSGIKVGRIEEGYRADLLELDGELFEGLSKSGDFILGNHIFADSHKTSIVGVWSAGKRVASPATEARPKLPKALQALRNQYLEN
ncbi:formimidoylglutamate deiminase [Marinobacterium lutimaris]|uniref:Formimidoylglutamate deiminase n=1 Tax=Marinobacterium lutimaris TaxID=568106 RepID=A0A1H5TV17_9GAMM|nr:formimidoylglutamate deiminase [Marinobacterium lutimaris]SEF66636.1 formimidoylglutamate deiminase [Marinobacterium lutimaris]